jgi:uncharacterized protein YcaQ
VAVSLTQLRRYVVAQQGFASRPRAAAPDEVERTIRRLSAVQLDSISTVERAHRLTLGARIGSYPADTVTALLRAGRIFEYWAHEASLIPIELYPHFRRVMAGAGHWRWHTEAFQQHAHLVDPVLERIRAEGPLPSRAFEGKGRGGMWNWKPAKLMLEALWDRGDLAIAGRQNFQRLYDLAERVIPKRWLDAPLPSTDESYRALALEAVRARGALTEAAIREHWRWKGGKAVLHHHLETLVAEGALREAHVEDGGAPFFVPAGAELDGGRGPAVFLCPFDNLVWDRPLLKRLFGFEHVIEVYKREHERVYGYYVLPLLAGDRIVGRGDLKSDRAEGVLRLKAFHREPGVRASKALDEAVDRALAKLLRIVRLDRVERPPARAL